MMMNKTHYIHSLLIFLLCSLMGISQLQAQVLEVEILQDDKEIEAEGNLIQLKRKPFTIVVTQRAEGDLLFNASDTPTFFELAKDGADESDFDCFGFGKLRAERWEAENNSICISPYSYANWHEKASSSGGKSQFKEVKVKRKKVIGIREVDKATLFFSSMNRENYDIASLPAESIYLIFFKKDPTGETLESVLLELKFTD